jgi:hypothetical protein
MQIVKEKVRGTGLEEVWVDENGWNETVVWKPEMKGRKEWRSSKPIVCLLWIDKARAIDKTYMSVGTMKD